MSYYQKLVDTDKKVSSLDPLDLDRFFATELPILNDTNYTKAIIRKTKDVLPDKKQINKFSVLEAMAASRDLNMMASSLNRHGLGLKSVNGLEEVLIELSNITEEVPTDTVYSYGTRNPFGDRIRKFTNNKAEITFIESFRTGMSKLFSCLYNLDKCSEYSIEDPEYSAAMKEANNEFSLMVSSIINVYQKITPETFTNELRPYFDPKMVGGKLYHAPGGAQMPILFIDSLLYGLENKEKIYTDYYNDNFQYQPKIARELALKFGNKPSLITKAMREINAQNANMDTVVNSINSLRKILISTLKFRFTHLRIANQNMGIRTSGSVGSGGYTVNILEYLINKNKDALELVNSTRQKYL